MDSSHKVILKKCRTSILADLCIEPILEYLVNEKIFLEEENESIMAKIGKKDRIREFLDVLPRRGPYAYSAFKTSLIDSDQEELASKLSQMEEFYPNNTNPASVYSISVSTPASANHSSTNNDNTDANKSSNSTIPPIDDAYSLSSSITGHILIINNCLNTKRYPTISEVADQDILRLSDIFTSLRFTLQVERNLSKAELMKTVKDIAFKKDFKDIDSFILVYLGHGVEHASDASVLGNDELPLDLKDIFKNFSNSMCPALMSKPKLFLIENYVNFFDYIICDQIDGIPDGGASNVITTPPELKTLKLPTQSDSYFCRLSLSKKQPATGSVFVTAFCQVIQEFLFDKNRNLHIEELLIKVNHKLLNECLEFIDELPKLENALVKDFYLKS